SFLIRFLTQVDFMVKHPLLLMFYADNLLLGICDSSVTEQKVVNNLLPTICLRFNSITQERNKLSKNGSTFVRVDVHDGSGKLDKRTLDSSNLIHDLCKLVYEASTENAKNIRVLSDFMDKNDKGDYKSFNDFCHYFRMYRIRLFKNE
ncbi:unnamed protein product, partial [Didymodactylos carnosus]